jgi:hypothetical protein
VLAFGVHYFRMAFIRALMLEWHSEPYPQGREAKPNSHSYRLFLAVGVSANRPGPSCGSAAIFASTALSPSAFISCIVHQIIEPVAAPGSQRFGDLYYERMVGLSRK